jgi:heme/copper-type cytochrome/quinol oxidase subunit 2
MFPVVADISVETATILSNAIEDLGAADGTYECENFNGIFISICDDSSVLAIADVIVTEKVASAVISTPESSRNATPQEDSMDNNEIVILVVIGVATIIVLILSVFAFRFYKRKLRRDQTYVVVTFIFPLSIYT